TVLWLSLAASRCDATAGTARDATLSNATPGATHPNLKSTSSDGGMSIRGGQEGTVLKSLTVEGEDRIHLEIERPTLKLDLDPLEAPGLELGNARDVLDRTAPDLCAPLVASTAQEPPPFVAGPWLQQSASGL